jgi:endonuclease/exonuclease/phosphatase family metal-dependent hydrolase
MPAAHSRLFPVLLAALVASTLPRLVGGAGTVRIATFNTSLNRPAAGRLIADLASRRDAQARAIAAVIQRVRPDIVLLNEFDYDAAGVAADLFQRDYLGVVQGGERAIEYRWRYLAPVNTGAPSGLDLDHDGRTDGPADALGFGAFPGQYGMLLLSRFPIDASGARTFQHLLWRDMPGARLPPGWYSPTALARLPLSSKSHWDVPIRIGATTLHVLASHPTPPVFDGPEDRNGRRNHDEIRLWADYLTPGRDRWIVDDAGRRGGLDAGTRFVILGDQNADPEDGESVDHAIRQLLSSPRVRVTPAPTSEGGRLAAQRQGGANRVQRGDPATDTADFEDIQTGNLRADYVLPSQDLVVRAAGVDWRPDDAPAPSDHHLVWIDVELADGD